MMASDEDDLTEIIIDQVVAGFVDWLYDECPVNPDEVTRERLITLWRQSSHRPVEGRVLLYFPDKKRTKD